MIKSPSLHQKSNGAGSRAKLHMAVLQNGQQFMQAGKIAEAIHQYETVLKDLPDHVEANYLMAQTASRLGATRKAVEHIRRALKLGSGHYVVQFAMAEVCMKDSLAAEALIHIDVALKLQPESEPAKTLKASILQQLGQMDEASDLSKEIAQANPHNDDAIGIYATSKKFDGTEPEIALLEQAYQNKPQPKRLRQFGYAMGKIFNDAKQYDKAFAYFKAAADSYDIGNIQALMTQKTQLMRSAFSKELILEKSVVGHQSAKPVFIVGMPRSGTTLTEQILASHPGVYGVGELNAIAGINSMISPNDRAGDFYLQKLSQITKKTQNSFAESYLNSLYSFDKSSKKYADKMPSNFFYIGLINILFPNAKIIHCTRDVIDNCVSCYTSPLSETHLYSKNMAALGHYYAEYHSLMQYWKSVSQIPIFDMPYERTVADLEGQARALIAHVGLPWDDACLRFNEADTQVSTMSKWQVRQPIYTTSVTRWKAYEKHIGPLIDALGDLAVVD